LALNLLRAKDSQAKQLHPESPTQMGIVYVKTILECDFLAVYMTKHLGVACVPYHSNLSNNQKSKIKHLLTNPPEELMFVVHCDMCKEGFNCPNLSVAVIMAPINSKNTLFFIQCAYDRVARLSPSIAAAADATSLNFCWAAHIISSAVFIKPKAWKNFHEFASVSHALLTKRKEPGLGSLNESKSTPQPPPLPTRFITSMGNRWTVDVFETEHGNNTAEAVQSITTHLPELFEAGDVMLSWTPDSVAAFVTTYPNSTTIT